ncbi:hypothetical protein ACJX0J_029657 [Zea mays]
MYNGFPKMAVISPFNIDATRLKIMIMPPMFAQSLIGFTNNGSSKKYLIKNNHLFVAVAILKLNLVSFHHKFIPPYIPHKFLQDGYTINILADLALQNNIFSFIWNPTILTPCLVNNEIVE